MDKKLPKLYLVVPCYNEMRILEESVSILLEKLAELEKESLCAASGAVFLVDDGSTDGTWALIEKLHAEHPESVVGLKLSRNEGHQNALLSGLMEARKRADVTISLDADLQDDVGVLRDFMLEYKRGSEIVYGVRSDRSSDTFFKRFTAETFYRLLRLLGVNSISNHADFRLMSSRALEELSHFHEVNLYLRALVPLIGFHHSIVFYKRRAAARPTHYSLARMLLLAWDGITSFSVRPIRMISVAGIGMFVASIAMLIRFLYVKFYGFTVPGWTSLAIVILVLGGLQLLSIGIIGEYIGKTYLEVKSRPRYIVEKVLEEDRTR